MKHEVRLTPTGRFALRVLKASLAALFGLCVLPVETASAQNDPREFCSGGQIAIVRLSRIAEGGSRSGFDQAQRDQIAWYRSHGFTTNQLIATDVIVQDTNSKVWSVSTKEVMSLHVNPPPIVAVKPDAAWNAFVSGFKKNSTVESERTVCLEQPLN